MLDLDDVLGEQLKKKEIEEQKCADNICQQEVRKKYQPLYYLGEFLREDG